ncbi:MAG TPA: ABC transporter permease [Woeseiaceae bacterium]|nr:ABC transporter permease [Woeseiaceae bacterium]
MSAIWHEMRQALSHLRRSPGFAFVATGILGLGLGATLYMFTVVKGYMLTPLPYPDAGRIMHVARANPRHGIDMMGVPTRDYREWQRVQQSFAALATYYTNSVILADGDFPERVQGAFVTPSAFDVVQTEALIGRTLKPSDAAPGAPWVVVLGFDVWQNRYNGDPAILGQTARVTGVPMTVVGVMPAGFRFPSNQQAWVPLKLELSNFAGGEGRLLAVSGRLKDGVTLEQARDEFANIAAGLAVQYPDNRNVTILIQPFQHAYIGADWRTTVLTMFGAVLFVLLIACSNVANLILARTAARQKDIALRAALGASRWRIVAHVLTESLVLAAGGALIAYFLADLGLELTQRMYAAADIEEPFWVVFDIDWQALLVAALAAVAAGVIAGLPPALRAARTDVNEYLKEGAKGSGPSASRLARTLVTGEIALSCVLLVCAGLMIRTVANFDARPLGVKNTNLLMGRVQLPLAHYPDEAAWYRFYEEVIRRLQAHPDVIDATAAYSYPGMNSWVAAYRKRGMEAPATGQFPLTQYAAVMDNYAEILGVELLRGRWFDARDAANSEPVAIVDARFAAKVFPGEDPIGRQVALAPGRAGHPSEWRTVVGVTEAIFLDWIDDVERPAVLVPLEQKPYMLLTVAVHTRGEPLAFAETLRETVRSVDRDIAVFWMRTYDNWIWTGNFDSRAVSILFGVFAVIAVVLAAAGIYGVLAFSVSQRTREIGVRRALGAVDRRILNMVLRQGLLQLGIGLGVGLLCAVGFARLLSSALYGVTAFDPVTLVVVALVLCAVAMVASLVPALRAMRVNPMEALRHE